jgi:hypothetical protein
MIACFSCPVAAGNDKVEHAEISPADDIFTKSAANRSQAAIGPLVEALDTISGNIDESTKQQISAYLTQVITAMADFAGADVSELSS